jgi:hypothetical protein
MSVVVPLANAESSNTTFPMFREGKVSKGCGGVRIPMIPDRAPYEGKEEETMIHNTS